MKKILMWVSSVLLLSQTAPAGLIISFSADDPSNRASMLPGDVAGANVDVRVGNWNNFKSGNRTLPTDITSPNAGNIVYNDGTVVGGSFGVTVTGSAGYSNPTAVNDAMLYSGYMQNNSDGATSVFTLTDIPFAEYDVYVYAQGQSANVRGGTVSISESATTYYAVGGSSPADDGSGYVAMSTTTLPGDKSTIAFGNYALYQGLSSSSQTITTTAYLWGDHARFQTYGFQIVEVVPEPGTFGLVAVGGMVLALGMMKRRK